MDNVALVVITLCICFHAWRSRERIARFILSYLLLTRTQKIIVGMPMYEDIDVLKLQQKVGLSDHAIDYILSKLLEGEFIEACQDQHNQTIRVCLTTHGRNLRREFVQNS